MGCRPHALSTTPSKADDARAFGADEFLCLTDEAALAGRTSSYDFILTTSPALDDWATLIGMLRPRGVLCMVGLPSANVSFPADELIGFEKSIAGSPIGSPDAIARMLRFAVEKGVQPRIELFPMAETNDAMRLLAENRVRYRAVLSHDSSVTSRVPSMAR